MFLLVTIFAVWFGIILLQRSPQNLHQNKQCDCIEQVYIKSKQNHNKNGGLGACARYEKYNYEHNWWNVSEIYIYILYIA